MAEADLNNAQAQWDLYCQTYPWDSNCGGFNPPVLESGPSVLPSYAVACASEAWQATTGVFASAVALLTAKGKLDDARLAARALSVASVWAARLTMVGAAAAAGYFTGDFVACVVDRYLLNTAHVAGSAAQATGAKPEPLFALYPAVVVWYRP